MVALPAAARAALAEELASLNEQLNEIASQRPVDPRRVFDLDETFHTRIIEASGGRRLATLYKSVRPQVERYWRLYASSIINELHVSVAEHNDIIKSIRKGDAAAIHVAIDSELDGRLRAHQPPHRDLRRAGQLVAADGRVDGGQAVLRVVYNPVC